MLMGGSEGLMTGISDQGVGMVSMVTIEIIQSDAINIYHYVPSRIASK